MKIFAILLLFIVVLSGCGNDTEQEDATISEETSVVTSQWEDGTYSGQSTHFEPYTSTVEFEVVDGMIVSIYFDESGDDVNSKKDESKNGNYGNDYPAGEWYEQIEQVEDYIIQNQQFPTLENRIDVDGVTGATLNLSGLENAFNTAVKQ